MKRPSQRAGRGRTGAALLGAAIALFGVGCSEIHPEPDTAAGGLLESPTHEADALRRAEQRQEQNQRNRGGGGGY